METQLFLVGKEDGLNRRLKEGIGNNINIKQFTRGQELLDELETRERPALVVINEKPEDFEGGPFLALLKAEHPELRPIFIAGEQPRDSREKLERSARQTGLLWYAEKPVSFNVLKQILEEAINYFNGKFRHVSRSGLSGARATGNSVSA